MTKLLYVRSSPRHGDSGSTAVAEAYLEAFRELVPALRIDRIDLWEQDLLEFGEIEAAAKTKVMTGRSLEGAEIGAWERITAVARRFIGADRYLLAVPMWNMGIPYRLKHYIDIVHQPGLTWTMDPREGFVGLIKDKHVTIALTSGAYAPGAPPGFGPDHHSTYVRAWLEQAGVAEIDELRFQPTLLTSDPAGGLARASEMARQLATAHGGTLAARGT